MDKQDEVTAGLAGAKGEQDMTEAQQAPQKTVDFKNFFPIIFIVAIAAVVMFMRLHFISLPLDNDEGTYAYIANFMNSHYMPYRDIFDHKPPGIYFIYRAAIGIFGRDAEGIRFFTALYCAVSAVAVYFAAARMDKNRAKYMATLFFAACQGSVLLQGINSNTETFVSLPVALAMFFAAKGKEEKSVMLSLSGLFLGVADLIKPIVLPCFILMLIYMVIKKFELKKTASFIAGFFAPFAATTVWLIAGGIFGDCVKSLFNVNSWYMTKGTPWPLRIEPRFLVEFGVLLAASVLLAFIPKKNNSGSGKSGTEISLVLLAGAIAGIILQKGTYPHYYLCVMAPLCVCAGIYAENISDLKARFHYAAPAAMIALFLAVFAADNLGFYKMNILDVSVGQFGTTRFAESSLMAGRINSIKKPGQTLFVYFAQPEIYFLTGMKAPGRYVNMFDWNVVFDEKGVNDELKAAYYLRPDYLVLYKKSLFTFASMLPYYRLEMDGKSLALFVKKDDAAKKGAVKR
jgi:4-amino-4-deoxy-L-arabinose transferase-like glycosyltransferase